VSDEQPQEPQPAPHDQVVVTLVADEAALGRAIAALSRARVVALDAESNGLHAYRAVLCTLQLGGAYDDDEISEVFVVDALALGDAKLTALGPLLGEQGPHKLVHDLAFDVRILAQHGLVLGRVIDTSILARFLGEKSTGLAALVGARVGIKLSKELQQHDWARRPLGRELLPYLAADVMYLPRLARGLQEAAREAGVAEDVEEETRYRLASALAAGDEVDPRPPYVRIKGAGPLDVPGLAVLRELAAVREAESARLGVPPFKVVANDVLLELARRRPRTPEEIRAVRGLERGRGAGCVRAFAQAIARGLELGAIPAEEHEAFFARKPAPPREHVEARRAREQRLTGCRRAIAKARGVDEQAVLPGHCVQDLAELSPVDAEGLARVPGLGAHRIARDGAAILAALRGN
jgi:ribonuclease D